MYAWRRARFPAGATPAPLRAFPRMTNVALPPTREVRFLLRATPEEVDRVSVRLKHHWPSRAVAIAALAFPAFITATPLVALAQGIDSTALNGLRWRELGPARGGR